MLNLAAATEKLVAHILKTTGVTVTYRRGTDAVQLVASPARRVVEQDRGDGTILETEQTEWLLRSADLVLGGKQVVPDEGDTIQQMVGAQKRTFEIVPSGASHYRPSDPYGVAYRAFSKLVETT